jgi:hypothetical protein
VQIHKKFSPREGFYSGQNTPLHISIMVSILLCIVSFVLTAILLLFYPYGVNYGEAPLLDQALHITTGKNIYKPALQLPPYIIANYTPIYPLLTGGIHRLTNLPLFQIGRAVSIFAAITSSFLLGSFAGKLFNSPMAGFLAAGLFLGHPYVGLWSGLVRVDSLALAFSLAGLWIVCLRWRSSSWLAIALICLLASVFTRQTYLLAAPLACVVWLLHNDWKRGVTFLAIFALLGLTVFLVLNTFTHGGFYQHIVTANINRYSLGRTLSMGILLIITGPVLLIMAGIAIRKAANRPIDPVLFWGLLPYTGGALLTALTVGKVGSDINYFLELISVSAIWAAGMWVTKPGRLIAYLLMLHTVWTVVFSGLLFQAPLVKLWNNIPRMEALARQVQAAVIKGPVLADDRLDLVVLAGQAIYYQPFEYTQMYTAGVWDITSFREEIASQKFPLILIHPAYRQDRWPPPIYDAIQQNYTCILQSGLLVCQP